jgi:4-amino-4-deoxy-L-arabinose transferase-like glycosyltransferase
MLFSRHTTNFIPCVARPGCGYTSKTIVLLLLLTAFRLVLAFSLELGNDESYYWMYSLELRPNYFDHPPAVALLIRLFTLNGFLDNAGWLRLGAVLGSALSAWFVFKALCKMHSPRAGFYAAALYQASFYAGLTAGVYIMPDSAQMIFWTAALWQIASILHDERNWNHWLLFALFAGAAIMSKVHGIFLCTGLALFVFFHRRQWLRLPQLYIAAGLVILIISPMIAWNIRHEFITYRFHSKRVTVDHFNFRFSYALKEVIGQLAFNNPVVVILVALGFINWKQIPHGYRGALTLFHWIALPHAGFLLFISFFRDTTLPHWSGPAYVTLIPLAAIRLAQSPARRFIPRAVLGALTVYLFVMISWLTVVKRYPGTYGQASAATLGTGDISLDLYGWHAAGAGFGRWYQEEMAKGGMPENTPVVVSYWWGAHLQYYFCRPAGIPFRAVGPVQDIREYFWRQDNRPLPKVAIGILASDESYELPTDYKTHRLLYHIVVSRGGKPAHSFAVYRLER